MVAKRNAAVYLASAARTATPTVSIIKTTGFNAITVVVEKTADASTPSVVFTIEGYDSVIDDWYTILTSAAVTNSTSNGTILAFHVGPGVGAVTNLAVGAYLPREIRIKPTHGDSDSITYSVSYHLMQ